VAVFPSDHYVEEDRLFMDRVAEAAAFVERQPERILLLGAQPTDAETEYGWIETGEIIGWTRSSAVRMVERFVEKPPTDRAQACLARGDLWNTFVFVAKASTLIDAGRQFLWSVHEPLARAAPLVDGSAAVVRRAYRSLPNANFSSAVLQNCAPILAALTLTGVTWSDWGSPRRVLLSLKQLGITPPWWQDPGLDPSRWFDTH
jgi:mannose-1-phosphate guanylyltransferase